MEYLKQYEILLKKAKSDLEASKILLKNKNDLLEIDTILFHLQQVVEKTLKALLAYNNVHFPKIHDDEVLFDKCNEIGLRFINKYSNLTVLDDYAVEGRYEDVGENNIELNIILESVEKMFQEIEKYIKQT